MRCMACNRGLNDFESTQKSATTGQYLDTCNKCLRGLGIAAVGRPDLKPTEEPPADWQDEDGLPTLWDDATTTSRQDVWDE